MRCRRTGSDLGARWADVQPTHHNSLYVKKDGCHHGTPSVKYRGIFLNDEQPALQNWAMVKFTNGTGAAQTGSPFNRFFYTKLCVASSARCWAILVDRHTQVRVAPPSPCKLPLAR